MRQGLDSTATLGRGIGRSDGWRRRGLPRWDVELDLNLAVSFVTLAQEQHYGRAAARLHVSVPTLSKRIQKLERDLGATLLERGPGGVIGTTPAGEVFVAAAGPLIRQADALVRATRERGQAPVVRIGVPSGTREFLRLIGFDEIARQVRLELQGLRMFVLDVPFHALRSCLVERRVDILLTVGPVHAGGIRSVRLPITARRAAFVHHRHPLADSADVDVAVLIEQETIFDPAVPVEFMRPFWLGDLRGRRAARLKPIHATDLGAVLRGVVGSAVMVNLDLVRQNLPSSLRPVTLTGAPLVHFCAAHRQNDANPAVGYLIEALASRPDKTLCPRHKTGP